MRHLGVVQLVTSRLTLTPLEVADASDMAKVLSDPALHTHTGGSPPSADELRTRYAHQIHGPWPEGHTWLNWVARLSGQPIGYIQATVTKPETADLAWVIATGHQRRGYAAEAARRVAEWLGDQGVRRLTAHVIPGHTGSERVAIAVGMRPTGVFDDDGEQIWALDGDR